MYTISFSDDKEIGLFTDSTDSFINDVDGKTSTFSSTFLTFWGGNPLSTTHQI
jgi:hypothetical protein